MNYLLVVRRRPSWEVPLRAVWSRACLQLTSDWQVWASVSDITTSREWGERERQRDYFTELYMKAAVSKQVDQVFSFKKNNQNVSLERGTIGFIGLQIKTNLDDSNCHIPS